MKHWSKDQISQNLLDEIKKDTSSILTEGVVKSLAEATEVASMKDVIKRVMTSIHEGAIDKTILEDDAEQAALLFENSVNQMTEEKLMNESAMFIATLTASVGTIMRLPYEASIHRVYNTIVAARPVVTIEEVVPTVKAPGGTFVPFIDAFGTEQAATDFLNAVEIKNTTLGTTGVVNGAKAVNLVQGLPANYKISKTIAISKVDVEIPSGTAIAANKVNLKKGSSPYFDQKTQTLNAVYVVEATAGAFQDVAVTAKINFAENVLEYVTGDAAIKKVYFDAPISHEEHTHPIETSFKNSFRDLPIPTRPHIEVSMPQEAKEDIQKSVSSFEGTDVVAKMTAQTTEVVARLEDMRLLNTLNAATPTYAGQFDFEAPSGFPYGNIEWIKREFIPFMDQLCTALKMKYNVEDCHFRIAVSPMILRYIDADYVTDKNADESAKGAGPINYTIGTKTATNTMYFISSQRLAANAVKVVLIPNNDKEAQVRTANYYKFSSFLTDQIRKASNPTLGAIVYSERNQEYIETPLIGSIEIQNMAFGKSTGKAFFK